MGCRTEPSEQQTDYNASPLFVDVQVQGIFEDSKTFIDLVPKDSYYALNKKYEKERQDENFDLKAFVTENSSQLKAELHWETRSLKKELLMTLFGKRLLVKNTKNALDLLFKFTEERRTLISS
jgi:neutral trehalase